MNVICRFDDKYVTLEADVTYDKKKKSFFALGLANVENESVTGFDIEIIGFINNNKLIPCKAELYTNDLSRREDFAMSRITGKPVDFDCTKYIDRIVEALEKATN